MRKKKIEKKKTIQPCGTIIPTKDYFKFKSKNIGVFKKPEIERKHNPILCLFTDSMIEVMSYY